MNIKRTLSVFFSWPSLLLLPIAYLLFFVLIIGSVYLTNEKDLIPHTGKVLSLKHKNEVDKRSQDKSGKTTSLILTLENKPDLIFMVPSKLDSRHEKMILSKINVGDSITAFTSPTLFESKRSTVLKLSKNGQQIIKYYGEAYRKSGSKFFLFLSLLLIIILTIYIWLLRKRYLKLKQPHGQL